MNIKKRIIYSLPAHLVEQAIKMKRKVLGKRIISGLDKTFSVAFVEYLIENKPSFNYSYFEEKDIKEIDKLIKNKKNLAFSSVFNEEEYFDGKDLEYQEKYRNFFKTIKVKGGWFEFKSYSLPLDEFTPSVFYHRQGLGLIPNLNKRLMGKDILDCGAFIGDSALIFEETACRRVYCFEPDKENFQLLNEVIIDNDLKKACPREYGVGDKESYVSFNLSGSGSYVSEEGQKQIKTRKIDSLPYNIGLIKMDIEGYEYKALIGAEKTIKEKKPILIISLYHTGKDFFEIPHLIKKWIPEYKFRFVNLNHASPFAERMLIAYIPGGDEK